MDGGTFRSVPVRSVASQNAQLAVAHSRCQGMLVCARTSDALVESVHPSAGLGEQMSARAHTHKHTQLREKVRALRLAVTLP